MKVTRIIAAAAMSAVLAGTAQAQQNCTGTTSAGPTGCTVTNAVTTNVPYVARLQVSAAATTLTAPTAENFGDVAGVSDANVLTLNVKANSSYKITASAAAANWTGGSGNKLATDLKISVDNFATSSTLSNTGVQLATGAAPTANQNYSIGYNVQYNWLTDTPGAYNLTVNYTLTSP